MIRRPPRSTPLYSSAASDVYKRQPPDDVKGIRSFMGLCNFFRHHIQDFSIIAAPLFKLTRQDSEYQSGPLTKEALTAFQMLQNQLAKQPALAFPRHDREYLLITNAYLPDKNSPGGLCANLAQRNHLGKIQIISHASRQLKENEKNYEVPPGNGRRCMGDGQLQRVP